MTKTTLGLAGALAVLGFSVAITAPAAAQTLLFDRGLPTTNLNDAAGSSRSNVAWGEGALGEVTPDTASVGENFTLSAPSVIGTIQVWVIDNGTGGTPTAGSYQLSLGTDITPGLGSTAAVAGVATSTSVTQVTYTGGLNYENSIAGTFSDIYQVDFTGLDLSEPAGTYAFSVSGLSEAGLLTPYLSASNATFGGADQIAGNDVLYGFDASGTMDTANGYPALLAPLWDKSSDVDVQVFDAPEPASMAILGVGVFALGAIRRRRRA
jgi:hypothetical protein